MIHKKMLAIAGAALLMLAMAAGILIAHQGSSPDETLDAEAITRAVQQRDGLVVAQSAFLGMYGGVAVICPEVYGNGNEIAGIKETMQWDAVGNPTGDPEWYWAPPEGASLGYCIRLG